MKRRLLAIAALLPACGEGLPLVERIASTRPLAIRVEAVEAGADPVRAEALPIERVRIVPLIVDPIGKMDPDAIAAEMDPVWLGCVMQPIEGLFSCLSNKLPLQPADVPDCPSFDPSMLDPSALPQFPSPCFIARTPTGQPEFSVPLDIGFLLGGDFELTMVGHVPGAGDTQACLDQLLGESGSISRDCVLATQRVAVGPDGDLLQLAMDLGIPTSQFGTIPDPVPDPDTHPRITSLTVRVIDENGDEIGLHSPARDGSSEPIPVAVGQRLDIEAIAPESDLQTYLIPRDMTEFDERTETYLGSWFTSWGTLLSPTSDDPLSLNEWTIHRGEQDETDLPANGEALLFYVLRDDRQGVDWWWFRVAVSE